MDTYTGISEGKYSAKWYMEQGHTGAILSLKMGPRIWFNVSLACCFFTEALISVTTPPLGSRLMLTLFREK